MISKTMLPSGFLMMESRRSYENMPYASVPCFVKNRLTVSPFVIAAKTPFRAQNNLSLPAVPPPTTEAANHKMLWSLMFQGTRCASHWPQSGFIKIVVAESIRCLGRKEMDRRYAAE